LVPIRSQINPVRLRLSPSPHGLGTCIPNALPISSSWNETSPIRRAEDFFVPFMSAISCQWDRAASSRCELVPRVRPRLPTLLRDVMHVEKGLVSATRQGSSCCDNATAPAVVRSCGLPQLHSVLAGPWAQPMFHPVVKWPEREADFSLPSSSMVKTPHTPSRLMGCAGRKHKSLLDAETMSPTFLCLV
jgi:hypothetical protein